MKLIFADKRITEYANGGLRFTNEGKPFEVAPEHVPVLLRSQHWLDGEFVDTFRPADENAKKAVAKELKAAYPPDFPHADKLAAAGISHAEVHALSPEQLVEIKGIGQRSAEAIFAATHPEVVEASADETDNVQER